MVILAPVGIKAVVGVVDEYLRGWVRLRDEGFHTFHWDALIIATEMGDGCAFWWLVCEGGRDEAAVIAARARDVIAQLRHPPRYRAAVAIAGHEYRAFAFQCINASLRIFER